LREEGRVFDDDGVQVRLAGAVWGGWQMGYEGVLGVVVKRLEPKF